MGKSNSILEISGSVGPIVFYPVNGVTRTRTRTGKKKTSKDKPNGRNSEKENRKHFGGGNTIAFYFRKAFSAVINIFSDDKITQRVSELFKQIILSSDFVKGVNLGSISKFTIFFKNFEFNRCVHFRNICYVNHTSVCSPDKSSVSLIIQPFNSSTNLKIPTGATHYAFISMIITLSDFTYNKKFKKYYPDNPVLTTLNALTTTEMYSVNQVISQPIIINTSLALQPTNLSPEYTLFHAIGIQFFKQEHKIIFPLKANSALKIASVF